jgi:hypothetical protein
MNFYYFNNNYFLHKNMTRYIAIFFFLILVIPSTCSQINHDSTKITDSTIYKVITTDGNELIGYIIKNDSREILLITIEKREVYIPQYAVKKLTPVSYQEFNANGDYIGEDKFATRYFITTNGLPLKKGENYMQWNWFGPDVQFAVTDRLGLGVMTSWFATPILGTAKYSYKINESIHGCFGAILGTTSWLSLPNVGVVGGLALPFASISFGNRTKNIAFSGGYGAIGYDGEVNGRFLLSFAGMTKIGKKVSLVFDSFIVPPRTVTNYYYGTTYTYKKEGIAILIPGLRFHIKDGNAFQFGLTGIISDSEVVPVPIPMLQWFRSF